MEGNRVKFKLSKIKCPWMLDSPSSGGDLPSLIRTGKQSEVFLNSQLLLDKEWKPWPHLQLVHPLLPFLD